MSAAPRSTILSAFAFVSVAILAAPTHGASQIATADKIEQKARGAAQEVRAEATDAWLTAKTKIALYLDEQVKGRQISVETVKGTVMLRGKVDSDEARTAGGSIAEGIQHVKAVKNELTHDEAKRDGSRGNGSHMPVAAMPRSWA